MGCILKGGGGLYSRVVVGAVLLAAGSGSRIGHRPKSLLELGGVPLIRRQLIALSGAGVDEVVVVLGPSGSGKSTLCRTINRLETVDSVTIAIDGEVVPAEGRKLARLHGTHGLNRSHITEPDTDARVIA